MKTRMIALAATLAVAACARQERVREIDWAKAALARNPAYEILATDESAGVFTVRDTATGVVHALKLSELVAAPVPPRLSAAPAAAPAPEAAPLPADEPATPEVAAVPDQTTETMQGTRAGSGDAIAEGPGYSITRGGSNAIQAANVRPQTLEGPGYTITRENTARRAPVAPEVVAASDARRTDPIICQGDRLMRIDGETIEFTGDAVIAEKGCDLYITNARIRAGGVGIIARQARVHIVNSTIGGAQGSYEASQGAEIYVARSTFSGIGRRFDNATMNDLGGNQYR